MYSVALIDGSNWKYIVEKLEKEVSPNNTPLEAVIKKESQETTMTPAG